MSGLAGEGGIVVDGVPVLGTAYLEERSPRLDLKIEAFNLCADLYVLPVELWLPHGVVSFAAATSSGVRWNSSVLRITHTVSSRWLVMIASATIHTASGSMDIPFW